MEKLSIDFARFKKLVVKVVDMDVRITGTHSSEAYISFESEQPHLEYKDDTLVITAKEKHFSLLGPMIFGSHSTEETMQIVVPYQLKELTVNGVSSDVAVYSIKGEVLAVKTISGDVVLENVEFSDCQMKTVSGDIKIDSPVIAKLVFSSVSGDLHIKNLICQDGDWIVSTTSGDLTMQTVGVPNMRLTLRTASGELNTNVGYTREGRDYLFGDGRMKMTISTASGDVNIISTNRAERSEGIEKKILRLVASGKLTYEQARQILDELS